MLASGIDQRESTMTNAIIETKPSAITTTTYPADRNPALVYLAGLSEASRRPQKQSLGYIANLVQPGTAFDAFAWHQLRYQHTQAIRSQVAKLCSAATAFIKI